MNVLISNERSVSRYPGAMAAAPPTRPALRERYERRRADVLATAARLFAEHGYHATSMADLTAATGLTAGGLYHYFPGKERLLADICDELLAPLLGEARLLAAADGPADERLRAVMRIWLAHIESHRDHMLVFAQERHLIEREPQWKRIRAQRREFEALLDELLASVEADGVAAFPDRRLALLALLGMVNYTPQWLHPGGRLSAEAIADGYFALLFGGIAPDIGDGAAAPA